MKYHAWYDLYRLEIKEERARTFFGRFSDRIEALRRLNAEPRRHLDQGVSWEIDHCSRETEEIRR